MCLSYENDKDGKPLCEKYRIFVLGKFEDIIYQKLQSYAPVLKYIYLCLLTAKAVGDKHTLQQGVFKNAFCNAKLPDDEVTAVRPPIGNPSFQDDDYWLLNKTLYVLRQSPIGGTTR